MTNKESEIAGVGVSFIFISVMSGKPNKSKMYWWPKILLGFKCKPWLGIIDYTLQNRIAEGF